MSISRGRVHWIDTAKGIAISLVVYGHCLRGLTAGGLISPESPIQITDYIIYTHHMPLFFVASGLFFASSYGRGSYHFWKGRSISIVYPYFLWSLIQGIIQIALSGSGVTNKGMDWEQLSSILWYPISPFWFLYALLFSNIAAVLLVRVGAEVRILLAFGAFLLSYFYGSGVIRDVTYGFLYFSLGMILTERKYESYTSASWPWVGGLMMVFIASAIFSYAANIPERLPIVAALLGIAALATLASAIEMCAWTKSISAVLRLCGQCSMGIFVLHILMLGVTRTVLVKFLHLENGLIILAVGTFSGILIPLVVQLVAIRLRVNQLVGLPASVGTTTTLGRRP